MLRPGACNSRQALHRPSCFYLITFKQLATSFSSRSWPIEASQTRLHQITLLLPPRSGTYSIIYSLPTLNWPLFSTRRSSWQISLLVLTHGHLLRTARGRNFSITILRPASAACGCSTLRLLPSLRSRVGLSKGAAGTGF